VLIVDPSQESREVLRTLLERRGIKTLEAGGARQGLELVRRYRPEVVVADLESEGEAERAVRQQYGDVSAAHHASLVLLANAPRRPFAAQGQRVVSKPYHYAPLIRTIEELLGHSVAAERST
jgi:CheY-like chemotaxis protein